MEIKQINAGKFSRVNLKTVIVPDVDDPLGSEEYLSLLDGTYTQFMRALILTDNHTVQMDEVANLPLIAFRWYKNINLWWLIGMVNGIIDPYLEITAGKIIRMPSLSSIEDYFRQVKKAQANLNETTSSNLVNLK